MKDLIKKIFCISLCVFVMMTYISCGESEESSAASQDTETSEEVQEETVTEDTSGESAAEEESGSFSHDGIDIDLTLRSSTMIYTEVYNMMYYPEEFIGKVIKLEGMYGEYYDEELDKRYFGCIVQDATACCAQGVEFILKDSYVYPDDYPEMEETITVMGTFDTYEEDGMIYPTLREAELIG